MTLDNEELQANDAGDNLNQAIEGGNVDENSESAPENNEGEEQPEKVVFNEAQQAKVNEIADKKTAQFRTEQRRADKLEQDLAEARALIPAEQRPVLPELPDPFDDGYSDALKKRDEVLVEQTRFDERGKEAARRDEADQQTQIREQQKQVIDMVTTYSTNAQAMGMSEQQSQDQMGQVAALGIIPDVLRHIVQDDKGPAISQHLLANPLVADEVRSMSPMQASVYIENTIKPLLPSKKLTNTPTPPTEIEGGGSPPTGRGPKGAVYS